MLIICITGAAIFTAAAVLIFKKSNVQQSAMRFAALTAAGAAVLSLGLELTLFNVNYYTSHGYAEIDLTGYFADELADDGVYTVPSGDTVEFPVECEIKNIKLDVKSSGEAAVSVRLYLTDEANANYFAAPERRVYPNVEASHYINVHTAGKSQKLGVHLESSGEDISIKAISLNVKREFDFSAIRVMLFAGILMLLKIFAPSSPLYKMKLTSCEYTAKTLIGSFMCLECAVIIILGTANPAFIGIKNNTPVRLGMQNHNQYDELAEAILTDGRLYIDNGDIPESLLDMKNPYDTVERSRTADKTGDSYRWDVAFFNGHYYVYFGIVPLLLMYLPFRAATGLPFPSFAGVMVFAAIFALGVFMLLKHIAKTHFKSISVGTFLLVSLGAINFSGMIFLAKRPDFYSVPIMCACAFTVWGIYCWLKALDTGKHRKALFFAGSLLMALSVGCRPQSVLVSAVALPLFLPELFGGKFKKKNGITELCLLAAPYIFVAAGIMYYNYIRFGSPFDFGSAYNLTTNDVTRRGFVPERIGLGIYTYLLQPPAFTAVFPFLQKAQLSTNYAGMTIAENCFGGLLAVTPFAWFIFARGRYKNALKSAKLTAFTAVLLLVGLALVIADTEAGGLLQRYFSDFGYLFMLAAAVVIFALHDSAQTERENSLMKKLVYISVIFCVFYTSALAFSVSDVTIDIQNPTLFGTISHIVQFWL